VPLLGWQVFTAYPLMSFARGYGYPKKLIVVVQLSFSLALIAMGFKKKAGEPS
jgi:hypothetical protein